jgi:outer membrane lipoprotein SlyB
MKTWTSCALGLALLAALAGCATSSPDVIRRQDTQTMSQVQDAVVITVRTVTVDGNQTGMGAAVGGVVGALAGSAGSSVQREQNALGLLAGVAGAMAGNAIERMGTREEALEVIVQLRNGERRAIVQAKGSEMLAAGDPVIIVTTGNKVRVSKAPR